MEYEKLLERAIKGTPKEVVEESRFNMPGVVSKVQGKKTIVKNFKKIAKDLNRKPEHLMKFLDMELATSGILKEHTAEFTGRFSYKRIEEKIKKYADEFVFCNECGKPDTKIIKEDRYTILKCTACGARRPVRNIK